MNKEAKLIWEAYTNKQINEHHASEWPESVLDMPVRELLDKLKDEEQVEGELYHELEDFIKLHWKDEFMPEVQPWSED